MAILFLWFHGMRLVVCMYVTVTSVHGGSVQIIWYKPENYGKLQ